MLPLKVNFHERMATQFADFSMMQPSDNNISSMSSSGSFKHLKTNISIELALEDLELEKALNNSYFVIPGREEIIFAGTYLYSPLPSCSFSFLFSCSSFLLFN